VDWLLVFLNLFWLRQHYNLFVSISRKLIFGSESFFGGDELKISRGLGIWDGSVPIITGLLVILFVLFKLIPRQKRNYFAVGGLIGGVLGHTLWMKIQGPILLPKIRIPIKTCESLIVDVNDKFNYKKHSISACNFLIFLRYNWSITSYS